MTKPPRGAEAREARTVRVRVELEEPATLNVHWPTPLDAILTHARPQRPTARGTIPHADLPVVRSRASRWWWWASCAAPDPLPTWWSLRRDATREMVGEVPAGTALDWWVIGDRRGIKTLLDGTGLVPGRGDNLDWQVIDDGPPDYGLALLTDTDRPGRPIPAQYGEQLGWDPAAETVQGPFRPSYRRPSQRASAQLHALYDMPLIAPWTKISNLPDPIPFLPPQ